MAMAQSQNEHLVQKNNQLEMSHKSNDAEITNLSNMVKNLLSEQAQLKDKLAAQEKELINFKEQKSDKAPPSGPPKRNFDVKTTRTR